MKIAFDAKRLFNNTTGLGNYSRTLVQNLSHYFPSQDYLLCTPSISEQYESYRNLFPVLTPTTQFKHIWRSYSIRKDLERASIDIYHGLSNEIPFWLKNMRTVVTIHDVLFKVLPETYPQLDRWLYDEKTRYACRYADQIIAISEQTKKDLIRFYGVAEKRIKVIYQACDPIYYTEEEGGDLPAELSYLPADFILSVGSIIERKNLLNLIKAYQLLPESIRIPLVVVGTGKRYQKRVRNFLRSNNLEHLVILIENLESNALLKRLYTKAQMFVYPSLYEGFGLPVVEAMLCGTPVITSNLSSLPEAGGPHSIYVNPLDIEELSEAMNFLLLDTQQRLRIGAMSRDFAHKRFNPKKLTEAVVAVYGLLMQSCGN